MCTFLFCEVSVLSIVETVNEIGSELKVVEYVANLNIANMKGSRTTVKLLSPNCIVVLCFILL